MAQFFTLLTEIGQAKLANAIALQEPIEITQLAVGDGGGSLPEPQGDEEQLINEVRRAAINTSDVDGDNPNWIVVEQVIPPDVGGWTIREVGIFDSAGDLIGYGNYPETYKPVLEEGSSRTQTVRFVLEVSDTAAVTLKVDPSVVLATREYVDTQRTGHEQDAEAHADNQITLSEPIDQVPNAENVQQALAALGEFAADGFQNIAVFNSVGTSPWPVPEELQAGHRKGHVTVVGGGGAGGAGDTNHIGRPGATGGWSLGMVDLSGISSVDVTVGAGGVSVTDSDGTAGGTSSFGTFMSATGGQGGGAYFGATAAEAGVGSGGDLNFQGNNGSQSTSGSGSNAPMPGRPGPYGGAGAGQRLGGPSLAGLQYGNAPGASGAGGSSGNSGGHGAPGLVIVRW